MAVDFRFSYQNLIRELSIYYFCNDNNKLTPCDSHFYFISNCRFVVRAEIGRHRLGIKSDEQQQTTQHARQSEPLQRIT